MYNQFAERGYLDPVRLLTARECKRFLQAITNAHEHTPPDWHKGCAAGSRTFYDIATHETVVGMVTPLIGEDVMLWGASMQDRVPQAVHPWHSDIESWTESGRMVSVWIGMENTSRDSSLQIIPYSHGFGVTVQELRHRFGKGREELTDDEIVGWAKERDQRSELMRFQMADGEALFFDGRIWHGSRNSFGRTRRALLLQYATPDTLIRIPALNHLDWPFHLLNLPRPPCLMVRGSDTAGVNRIVSPPSASSGGGCPRLTNRVYPLDIPFPADQEKGWKPYFIFNGSTSTLRSLTCHVSVLTQGQCPHLPHRHQEEELLILLAGQVDLLLPDLSPSESEQRRRLTPGELVYYPVNFAHTIKTASETPANYLMFRWNAHRADTASTLAFGQFTVFDPMREPEVERGFCPRLLFEGPTAYLHKLHCHASTLTPGAGYDPHIDAHDVAIIVLEGEVETLGRCLGPHSVIFYAAGEPHGMRNPGHVMAKYVVFEFHGSQEAPHGASPPPTSPSFLAKLRDPKRWKRKLKHLLGQLKTHG